MKSIDELKYLFFIEQLDFLSFAKTEEFDVYYVPSDMAFQPLTIFELLSIFERVLDTPLTDSTSNMLEYGFSLTRILSYKDRICGSVLIRENTGQY